MKIIIKPLILLSISLFDLSNTSAQQNKIELDKLITIFLDNFGDWRAGASQGTPIKWTTKGIESTDNGFERNGTAVVTINRKLTHEILDYNVKSGTWEINLEGSHCCFNSCTIQTDCNSQEIDVSVYRKYLVQKLNLKLISTDDDDNVETYKPGAAAWKDRRILFEWSCGSGGCWLSINIE